ncbi:MAG: enoyl-CoA hydratase-related protein [Pseudomonadota bacterium]|nr:enoyl-CoA hydratase-related protein [Pseudomonadota bacterium]
MIDLSREDAVFTLTMNAGENRWNLAFVRAFSAALDDVEAQLAEQEGPASLVTCSTDAKFFSNGLDLDWIGDLADSDPDGEREAFGEEFMALMGRIITFPIPTIAAISGHAFGAGMMCSMCHDVRIMRADRGFLCANEMQIGFRIPTPELALFRHKLSGAAFFETVQLAKRWTGESALAAGVVQQIASFEDLPAMARGTADQLAPLGANRALYGEQKERLFGEHAVLDGPHGAAHMLKHSAAYH